VLFRSTDKLTWGEFNKKRKELDSEFNTRSNEIEHLLKQQSIEAHQRAQRLAIEVLQTLESRRLVDVIETKMR